MNIAILQLKDNYYFVGSTPASTKSHILNYFHTYTNDWLELHPIVDVIEIIPIPLLGITEQEKAIEIYNEIGKRMNIMMCRYSISHVRSDVMISVHLSKKDIQDTVCFLKDAKNICYKCHSSSHTSLECKYTPSECIKEKQVKTNIHILTPFEAVEDELEIEKEYEKQYEVPEKKDELFSSSHFDGTTTETTMNMFSSHSMLKSSYL